MSFVPQIETFNVARRKAFFASDDNKSRLRSPGHNMIIIERDGQNDIVANRSVSDSYEIHQPSEIMATFQDVAEKTGLEIKNVLTNPNNGGLMISARYGKFNIGNNDPYDIDLVFYTSHCGKYRTFLTLNTLRLACMNQLPALYREKDRFIFAEKHYKNALDITMIKESLEYIPESINMFDARVNQLIDTKVTYKDFVEFYIQHFKLNRDAKQFQNKIDSLAYIYNSAPGQKQITNDNAYKALNAITYIQTHDLSDIEQVKSLGKRNTKFKDIQTLKGNGDKSLKAMDALLALAA